MLAKRVVVEKANRIYQMPPDILSQVRPRSGRSLIRKAEVIDLASFEWPLSRDAGNDAGGDHTPATPAAVTELKEALAEWYAGVHGAKLNPVTEVFVGGSITTNLLLLAMGFIDTGDIAFVPDLGLPVYRRVVTACGGEPVSYGVSPRESWRPNFERVGTRLGRVAALLIVNSPHNPTGAELSEKDLADLIWLASRENILIVNDAAYQTVSEPRAASLMSMTGGRKVGVEVGSFSYLLGLPRVPFGFVVGHRDVISGLQMTADLMPPYILSSWVKMALDAIRQYPSEGMLEVRRHLNHNLTKAAQLGDILKVEKAGIDSIPFSWARIAGRSQSARVAARLYRRQGILVAPGVGFGDSGEGFIRLSLTPEMSQYQAAIQRLQRKRGLSRRKADK